MFYKKFHLKKLHLFSFVILIITLSTTGVSLSIGAFSLNFNENKDGNTLSPSSDMKNGKNKYNNYLFSDNKYNDGYREGYKISEKDDYNKEKNGETNIDRSPYFFKVNPNSPLGLKLISSLKKGGLSLEEQNTADNENEDNSNMDIEKTPQSSQSTVDINNPYEDSAVSVYLEKYALTPGETLNIYVHIANGFNSSPDTYVNAYLYRGFYRDWNGYYENYYNITEVWSSSKITDSDGNVIFSFNVPSIEGIYTLYINAVGESIYRDISVGDLGLYFKGTIYYQTLSPYQAGIQIVKLPEFSGAQNSSLEYSFSYYNYTIDDWDLLLNDTTESDETGFVKLVTKPIPISPDEQSYYFQTLRLTLTAKYNGSSISYQTFLYKRNSFSYYNYWRGEQDVNTDSLQFITTADNTLYQPGEIVHLRMIALENNYSLGIKQPFADKWITLKIYNPKGLIIYQSELQTDSNGLIKLDYPLDNDAQEGSYQIEWSYNDNEYSKGISSSYIISVQYYEKPVFRVSIDTGGRQFYPESDNGIFGIFKSSEWYEARVHVDYYFGQPVIDALVDFGLYTYDGNRVYSFSGKTNGEGYVDIKVDLSIIDDLHYSFYAVANVSDQYNRKAVATEWYSRFEEIYAYGYLKDWSPRPDEDITYYFSVYQLFYRQYSYSSDTYDGGSGSSGGSGIVSDDYYSAYWDYEYNPLSSINAEILIYGVNDFGWDFYELSSTDINKDLIMTLSSTTNNYGIGRVNFRLPENVIGNYDLFIVRVKITLNDGRSTTDDTYFRLQKYAIEFSGLKDHYELGESSEFSVRIIDTFSGKNVDGYVRLYLYDSNWNLINQVSIKCSSQFNSDSQIIDFQLPSSSYAPKGEYKLSAYIFDESNNYFGIFYYYYKTIRFEVGNKDEFSIKLEKNGDTLYDLSYLDEGNTNVVSIDYDFGLDFNNTTTSDINEIKIDLIIKTNITTNLPIMVNIFKQGLISSISASSPIDNSSLSVSITITSNLIPSFTIVVYGIDNHGKIYEETIFIELNYNVGLSAKFDKDTYEPGDIVTLELTPLGITSDISNWISISFIDSSILDINPPQDTELDYFSDTKIYSYLTSGSTWGTNDNSGMYWWYCNLYTSGPSMMYYRTDEQMELGYGLMGVNDYAEDTTNGGASLSPPSFDQLMNNYQTDLRDNISASSNWIAFKEIRAPTNITFKLPDNIGEWTIRIMNIDVVNTNSASQSNSLNSSYIINASIDYLRIKTPLPFFVEFELPGLLQQDDIVSVKAYVYNFMDKTVNAFVAIDTSGMTILNNETQYIRIPSNFVTEVEFSIYLSEPYSQNISIIAAVENSNVSDAKQIQVYIHPNALELEYSNNVYMNETNSEYILNYQAYNETISSYTDFTFYGDSIDLSLNGWERLIGYPYGCVEQTLSKLIPTALIYDYLQNKGELTESLSDSMTQMIMGGLGRIYAFQHTDGGWGWWKNDDSQPYMTALVLEALGFLSDSGFDINSLSFTSGKNYLLKIQSSDGYWNFSYDGFNTMESTAFVIHALTRAEINQHDNELNNSITKALDWFAVKWNNSQTYTATITDRNSLKTSFSAALILDSLYNNSLVNYTSSNYSASNLIKQLLDFLESEFKLATNPNEIFWDSYRNYGWYLWGNNIETTAYSIIALSEYRTILDQNLVARGLKYILNNQNSWGWGTTSDTRAALYAFTKITQIMGANPIIDFDGEINIELIKNGVSISTQKLEFSSASGNNNWANEALTHFLRIKTSDINSKNDNITIKVILNGTGTIFVQSITKQLLRPNLILRTNEKSITKPGDPGYIVIEPNIESALEYTLNGIDISFIGNKDDNNLEQFDDKIDISSLFLFPVNSSINSSSEDNNNNIYNNVDEAIIKGEHKYYLDSWLLTGIKNEELVIGWESSENELNYELAGITLNSILSLNKTLNISVEIKNRENEIDNFVISKELSMHKTIGPITFQTSNSIPLPTNYNIHYKNYEDNKNSYKINDLTLRTKLGINKKPVASSLSTLFADKKFDAPQSLVSGAVVNVSIVIENNGLERKYYTLDDYIPAGTDFDSSSLSISFNGSMVSMSDAAITFEDRGTMLHWFFRNLKTGRYEISYRLVVNEIKNSYDGGIHLWGMYDDFEYFGFGNILDRIERLFNPIGAIFSDNIKPTLSNLKVNQVDDSTNVLVNLKIEASDNIEISKVRIVYNQGNGWHMQEINWILPSYSDSPRIDYTLNTLENEDSTMTYYIELIDIYGNIQTGGLYTIKLFAKYIPYLTIAGILIGSGLIAGLASIYFKKQRIGLDRQEKEFVERLKKVNLLDLDSTDSHDYKEVSVNHNNSEDYIDDSGENKMKIEDNLDTLDKKVQNDKI